MKTLQGTGALSLHGGLISATSLKPRPFDHKADALLTKLPRNGKWEHFYLYFKNEEKMKFEERIKDFF